MQHLQCRDHTRDPSISLAAGRSPVPPGWGGVTLVISKEGWSDLPALRRAELQQIEGHCKKCQNNLQSGGILSLSGFEKPCHRYQTYFCGFPYLMLQDFSILFLIPLLSFFFSPAGWQAFDSKFFFYIYFFSFCSPPMLPALSAPSLLAERKTQQRVCGLEAWSSTPSHCSEIHEGPVSVAGEGRAAVSQG